MRIQLSPSAHVQRAQFSINDPQLSISAPGSGTQAKLQTMIEAACFWGGVVVFTVLMATWISNASL